ncbi:CotH kinase family protein [Neobacillus cucumis]|uniref:CotH kinase family protein n=1 Tax=Neobacillus cucumis TaxID=1740721 RepID=UPI001E316301|nr:CotH kinase family protein [Neobacillus cucumis]
MLKYEIFINPKILKNLEQDIWTDPVPAVLKMEGNQYAITLAYRGNVIRKKKKKSYHIIFKKPYTVNGAHEIHLNAEYSDISLSRNKLALDFFHSLGVISPQSKHVLLFINGYCKGIYLELESFDKYLLNKRNLPHGAIIYATNYHANFSLTTPKNKLKNSLDEGYTVKYGSEKDLARLEDFIAKVNTLNNNDFEKVIPKFLDIDQYVKWLTGVVCTQNFDGFIHNYALYHNGKSNLYEMTPWDYDGTWGRDLHGRKLSHDFVPITGYNTLTNRLLTIPHFKEKYVTTLSSALANQFTVNNLEPIITDLFNELKPYISLDPYLTINEQTLEKEKLYILRFIKKRNSYLKEKMMTVI